MERENDKTTARERQLANLRPFTSTNQPKNRGRKKRIYTVIKEMGYSRDDIFTIFKELAFYKAEDLYALMHDGKMHAVVRLAANLWYKAMRDGEYKHVRDMMEYILGKAPLDVNVSKIDSEILEITYEDMNGAS